MPQDQESSNIPEKTPSAGRKTRLQPLLPWLLVASLLLAIAVMLVLWRPWQEEFGPDSRTVEVTGTATLKAEPDEYVFYPAYNFKNSNQQQALAQMAAKSEEVTKELKELGVTDSQIKTNSSGYEDGVYLPAQTSDGTTYTLNIAVTVNDKEMAQKVQNYLITTDPTGSISPYATFSTGKQKELESQAREEASRDARAKADQSAANLGFSVAAVKSVNDGAGFGSPIPLYGRDTAVSDSAASPELKVQPGENEFSYSVTVVYFIR